MGITKETDWEDLNDIIRPWHVLGHDKGKIKNPVTGEYEKLSDCKDGGYKQKYLSLLLATASPYAVRLDSSPVLTFDKDRWELEETENNHVLKKKEPEETFDEKVMESDSV